MEEELLCERQGINFGRSAPQIEREHHADNPEEENALEDMEDELPFEWKAKMLERVYHKQ